MKIITFLMAEIINNKVLPYGGRSMAKAHALALKLLAISGDDPDDEIGVKNQ